MVALAMTKARPRIAVFLVRRGLCHFADHLPVRAQDFEALHHRRADGADAPVDAQKDTRAGETEFASV
jgi:hypothetical protein